MATKPAIIRKIEATCGKELTRLPNEQLWATPLSFCTNDKDEVLTLNLSAAGLESFTLTKALRLLKKLDISRNVLLFFTIETNLPDLELLDISYNEADLQPIGFRFALPRLKYLYIYRSKLQGIVFDRGLPLLDTLHLAGNNLEALVLPGGFDQLVSLYLYDNRIGDILQPPTLHSLLQFLEKPDRMLVIDRNPFLESTDLNLERNENHAAALLNFLLPYKPNSTAVDLVLPAKVLLLGNHASGKSSLLHYLQNGELAETSGSTHIIRIAAYPETTPADELPAAIVYDFGGQDYYHGLYRIFLSQGAVQVLLWSSNNNNNKVLDKDANHVATIHYNLAYWLAQNQYIETNRYGRTDKTAQNPLLLVQRDSDTPCLNAGLTAAQQQVSNIQAEFLLTLKKSEAEQKPPAQQEIGRKARELFAAHLALLIKENQKPVKRERWYKNFLNYLLDDTKNSGYAAIKIDTLEAKLQRDFGRAKDADNLEEHLVQLHRQGLVLYYEKEMPERVWLNPGILARYVHKHILAKERRETNRDGKIAVKELVETEKVDPYVLRLLEIQQVLFLHRNEPDGVARYIIPNYLPLAREDNDFDLLTFGIQVPCFVLRFGHFIPFGLINRLICFFGQLPEKKRFWRDRLLFTHRGILILLELDVEQLEIRLHAGKALPDKDIRHLFTVIMALYRGKEPSAEGITHDVLHRKAMADTPNDPETGGPTETDLSAEAGQETGRAADGLYYPPDLYLSVDDRHFLSAAVLGTATFKDTLGLACIKDEAGFHEDRQRLIPLYPFRHFTNQPLFKMKKIFISYSRTDTAFKNELQTHLSPYSRYGAISSWNCDQMRAGAWHAQVQRELAEADILIFMISPHFMASDYIMEKEVKKGIDLVNADPAQQKKVYGVLVRECAWRNWPVLVAMADAQGKPAGETVPDLTNQQLLPYHPYKDAAGTIIRRELLALEQWGRLQYEMPSVAYRDIADKIFAEVKG